MREHNRQQLVNNPFESRNRAPSHRTRSVLQNIFVLSLTLPSIEDSDIHSRNWTEYGLYGTEQ